MIKLKVYLYDNSIVYITTNEFDIDKYIEKLYHKKYVINVEVVKA